MFQNIKVDIIYYKTATDFEMEFNLSGCCRMRLLTDKAADRKILISQLSRAVRRSRIIIIAGALFGESGVIETCAKAIGRPLNKINNSQFGIDSEDNIEIIKDSIPLVSKQGIFGGCIIEQGPQTLILLSENKNIRKNIMQTLIHPYVKEVCAGDLIETSMPQEAIKEDITSEVETVVEPITDEIPEVDMDELETNEVIEEVPVYEEGVTNQLITDDEEDIPEVIFPVKDENKSEDVFNDLFSENVVKEIKNKKKEKSKYEPYIEDLENLDLEEKPKKKTEKKAKNKKNGKILSGINIPIFILIIVLIITIALLCYTIFIIPDSNGVTTGEYLKETFDILFG